MNRIYILGASGFIGTNLTKYLESFQIESVEVGRNGAEIVVDLNEGNFGQLDERIESGDTLIFLASISAPSTCESDPEMSHRVNLTNTSKLIASLLRRQVKVLFASSDLVFGSGVGTFGDEDTPLPFGKYGEMKAAIETEFSDHSNFKAARLSLVCGPGDDYSNLLAEKLQAGEEIEVFLGFERCVVSLADVLEGIKLLIENWDHHRLRTINFSGPELLTREELTRVLSVSVFQGLNFKTSEAPSGFWDSRSKSISTGCAGLASLLNREPTKISQAVKKW